MLLHKLHVAVTKGLVHTQCNSFDTDDIASAGLYNTLFGLLEFYGRAICSFMSQRGTTCALHTVVFFFITRLSRRALYVHRSIIAFGHTVPNGFGNPLFNTPQTIWKILILTDLIC